MARIVGWFLVLVVVLVAQTQNNDKVDVETFLENIKKMLQETVTVEKMRKQQENRMKRRKDKKNKIKTRKMLRNKLANPYVLFRRQHTIIDYKKRPDTQSNRSNLQQENNELDGKTGRISPQTVNKVLRANPAFNPFKTDRLKDILSKIQRPQGNVQNSSTSSGATEPDPQTLRYMGELYNWFEEVYSKIDWFWNTVYRLFILDEKRFEYLSEVLCKGEITTPSYSTSVYECYIDNLPKRFKVIRLDKPTSMPCNSLEPSKLKIDTGDTRPLLGEIITCMKSRLVSIAISVYGKCTPSLYTKAKLIGNEGQEMVIRAEGIRPAYASRKSLCYNLAALNFVGYKNGLKKYYNSAYISSKISYFILYVKFMKKIFKEKIIPAVVDMCHIRCLCEDIGIGCTKQQRELSQEETIMLILWNLQKNVYLSFIESLSKLVSFKEGLEKGEFRICDKMQDDFKEIMDNTGKDIAEKKDKLSKMKKKIEYMESVGQVDPLVYVETINLVEEVREELITVREELIKLWQNRIGNAISLDDLICVLDSFKKLIDNINVDNKNVLELYLSDLINGDSSKIKGLSEFTKIMDSVGPLYVSFQFSSNIEDLFKWVSALDYSIYAITAAFNALKCVIGSVRIEEFLRYLASQANTGVKWEDVIFLECFMSSGKTIKQCIPERYGIIGAIIGDVAINNLGDLNDRIEDLKKRYNKWEDIDGIKDCCGVCKNIPLSVNNLCEVLTSPIFKEKCCKPPLGKCCEIGQSDCRPSSEPFCIHVNPATVDCNDPLLTYISRSGSPCYSLAMELSSLFSISYNNNSRMIFCDVIDKDKYAKFCEDPVYFINSIKDSNGEFVMEKTVYKSLKCDCLKCGVISQDICNSSIFIDYSKRNEMEKFLERVGLLEEAQKTIKDGLELGKCPFQ